MDENNVYKLGSRESNLHYWTHPCRLRIPILDKDHQFDNLFLNIEPCPDSQESPK